MGSHLSCMSLAAASRPDAPSVQTIKFLNCSTGAISELEGPLTAAEAMMEFPMQFLCAFSSAASSGCHGRRVCAVPADEDLEDGELYLLLPMPRLNTRFSAQEMEAFAAMDAQQKAIADRQPALAKAPRIVVNKVAPFPQASSEQALHSLSFSRLEWASCDRFQEGLLTMGSRREAGHAFCRSKSWMPMLETVSEHAVAQ